MGSSNTYHFKIPGWFIHLIHAIAGVWLLYIGYNQLKDISIHIINYYLLILIGLLVIIYFLILLKKNWKKKWNYAFEVPNWLIHIVHIINGIVLLLVGLNKLDYIDTNVFKKIIDNDIINIYLIGGGLLAGAYHAHLSFIKH